MIFRFLASLCIVLGISFSVSADEKQFYTHRADLAGEYYAAILYAIKLKDSDCPVNLHKDWFNKELVQKQIISYFPSNYKIEMRTALSESEKSFNNDWLSINQAIKKRRAEGVSCEAILNRAFWLQFDNAVKKWNNELKNAY
jgi:hypothetical protein